MTTILILSTCTALGLFIQRRTLPERGILIMYLAGWVASMSLVGVVARLI